MSIVVGYVVTPEGRAALRRAADEAQVRSTKLIVVNSNKGGAALPAEEAMAYESELADIGARLSALGIEHEVRQLVRGNEPAVDLIDVADEVNAGGQVAPGQHRSAGSLGRFVPRSCRQV